MKKDNLELILDFDYTLFDARRFRLALAHSLKKLGVPTKVFLQLYPLAVSKQNGHYSYDYYKHVMLISRKYPKLSQPKARKLMEVIVRSSYKYLYSETVNFLRFFKKNNFKLILVTHGNPSFQKKKLEYSGINHFFSSVVLSPAAKVVTLKRIKKNFGKAFFVSDHINELLQIKHHLPKLIPIMKASSHYSDIVKAKKHRISTFKTLTQIKKFIMKELARQI